MSVWQGLCDGGGIAFKGIIDEDGIYYGFPFALLTGGNTSVGPALTLAPHGGPMYMAWRGAGNDQSLYYASFTPLNAETGTGPSLLSGPTQIVVDGITPNSRIGPTLAVIGTTLYAAWIGVNNDLIMKFASFDPSKKALSSLPAIPLDPTNSSIVASSIGPSLAAIGPTLYAAWATVSSDSDAHLYYAALDTSFTPPSWVGPTQISNYTTGFGISLAALSITAKGPRHEDQGPN